MLIIPTITIVLAMLSAISVVVRRTRLDEFALVISARSHSLIPRLARGSFELILEMRRLATFHFFVVFCLLVVDTSFVGRPAVFGVISLGIGFVWAMRRAKVKVRRLTTTRLRRILGRGHSTARPVHRAIHSTFYLYLSRPGVTPSVMSVSPVTGRFTRLRLWQSPATVRHSRAGGDERTHTLPALVVGTWLPTV